MNGTYALRAFLLFFVVMAYRGYRELPAAERTGYNATLRWDVLWFTWLVLFELAQP